MWKIVRVSEVSVLLLLLLLLLIYIYRWIQVTQGVTLVKLHIFYKVDF